MNTLFVQQDAKNDIGIEAASFIEAAQQSNWIGNKELWEWTSDKVYAKYLERKERGFVIPVGSVEFVQQFLAKFHYPELRAVNIPPELAQEKE